MTLNTFFSENPSAALAFSGGVDSAYLLYAALDAGADVTAYYVKSAFQPEFELRDAQRLARELGAKMRVIELDVLCDDAITANPADRCYHCKRRIFTAIVDAARADGYTLLIDGTNASDDDADRPGIRALRELAVRSPLRECGITKAQVREKSREAKLFTWDKPAYACLATRIPTGTEITPDLLEKTERSEAFLKALGFSDFRIRYLGSGAKLEVRQEQLPLLLSQRETIVERLKNDYTTVLLDLEVRQ